MIYLLLAAGLIIFNGMFGLFDHVRISRKKIALALVFKTMAIPSFYLLYEHHYGGLEGFDSGKFFNDAAALNKCAIKHPATFFEMFVGIQDEKNVIGEHRDCLEKTQNWLKGRSGRVFYHDNRILIRVHTLLHFFAFNSWFVHAFFSCLMSFVGLFFLLRTFNDRLQGKEFATFLLLCLFPSLWLYTGALLKEGLLVLVMGLTLWLIRNTMTGKQPFARLLTLSLLVLLSIFLKPYLLITAELLFAVCFFLEQKSNLRCRPVYLLASVLLFTGMAEIAVRVLRNKSLADVISTQQRVFRGMADGGIFMSGDTTYLKLPYDTTLIEKADETGKWFTVKYGAGYMYWNDSRQHDTLYNRFNSDTITKWELEFSTPASRSNFHLPDLGSEPAAAVTVGIWYGLFYPFFDKMDTPMDLVASLENLLLMVCLIIVLAGVILYKNHRQFPLTTLVFVIMICLLVTLTSPNTGAVVRYRAPAVIFLLIGAAACLSHRNRQTPGNTVAKPIPPGPAAVR